MLNLFKSLVPGIKGSLADEQAVIVDMTTDQITSSIKALDEYNKNTEVLRQYRIYQIKNDIFTSPEYKDLDARSLNYMLDKLLPFDEDLVRTLGEELMIRTKRNVK